MFERLLVRIPAPNTGWTFGHFFTLICCKNCIVCLKRPKINEKEAGVGPFKKDVFVCWVGTSTDLFSTLDDTLISIQINLIKLIWGRDEMEQNTFQ